MTLDDCRLDFEQSSNRAMSMPIAGAVVWALVAILSTQFEERISILLLLFCSGLIFPIALGIARIRSEALISNKNPMASLMGQCVLMVNLLWAVHIPLFLYAPSFVPLSLGISLGLHWVVYSWIIQHPLGRTHAILRTSLVLFAWYIFKEDRLLSISIVIVCTYLFTLYQMSARVVPST